MMRSTISAVCSPWLSVAIWESSSPVKIRETFFSWARAAVASSRTTAGDQQQADPRKQPRALSAGHRVRALPR